MQGWPRHLPPPYPKCTFTLSYDHAKIAGAFTIEGFSDLRRLLLLFVLVIILMALVLLNRALTEWHYVQPVQPGQIVYAGTFDSTDHWTLYDGRLAAQLNENTLRLLVNLPLSAPYSVIGTHYADFDVSVQARAVEGPPQNPLNNGFGLVFRLLDEDNNYQFLISSDGYYQVRRTVDGNSREISTWIDTPVVQQGLGALNTIRVVGHGNRFQFYVNNERVPLCIPNSPTGQSTYFGGECRDGTLQDTLVDDTFRAGSLGVVAITFDEPGVVVDFDNLLVSGPQPITE